MVGYLLLETFEVPDSVEVQNIHAKDQLAGTMKSLPCHGELHKDSSMTLKRPCNCAFESPIATGSFRRRRAIGYGPSQAIYMRFICLRTQGHALVVKTSVCKFLWSAMVAKKG